MFKKYTSCVSVQLYKALPSTFTQRDVEKAQKALGLKKNYLAEMFSAHGYAKTTGDRLVANEGRSYKFYPVYRKAKRV